MNMKNRHQPMRFHLLSILIFTLFVLVGQAPGNSQAQTEQVLTLEKAVVVALRNNPSLAQQVNAVESAEVTVSQEEADLYPNLVLGASGSERFDKLIDETSDQTESRSVTSMSVELSSSLNLFNGFADIAALKNAELVLEAEMESLSQEEQTLIFDITSQFIQVLTNQELIHVEKLNLEDNSKLLERIETFYQAGKLPVSDLYQQQSKTKQAELDLLEAEHELNVSKLNLMQTMGMDPIVQFQVVQPDFEKMSLQLPGEEPGQRTLHALANRSDVKAQERQVEAAEQEVKEARAGYLPTVDLVANLGTNYSGLSDEDNFSEQFNDFLNEFMDENLNSTIGITFSIPLFDRFQARNDTVKAQIEKRNEQLTLKEKKLQVGLEVAQAIQDYKKTQKQFDVVESKLTHARQAFHSYEERYRVGASTLLELTEARTQLVTAAYDRVEAKYDLVTQEVAVAYYAGDLKEMFADLSGEEN